MKYGVLVYKLNSDFAAILFDDKDLAWKFLNEIASLVEDTSVIDCLRFEMYTRNAFYINNEIAKNIQAIKTLVKSEFSSNPNPSGEWKLLNEIFKDEEVTMLNETIPVFNDKNKIHNFLSLAKDYCNRP